MQTEQKTMAQTMAPTMTPNNAHKDIPGNPSTAKSSTIKLNDRRMEAIASTFRG